MSISQPGLEGSPQPAFSPHSPRQTSLFRSLTAWLSVSEQRKQVVLADIVEGSSPTPLYYILEGVSVVIASFGLLVNSSTLIIGAMLVSPLMTPILGTALALARGDLRLLRAALTAEIGAVMLVMLL